MSCWCRVSRILTNRLKATAVRSRCITFIPVRSFASVPADDGPIQKLQQKCSAGELKIDECQQRVMEELQRLYGEILSYEPSNEQTKGFLTSLFSSKNNKKFRVPKGLYIHGSVGGGKTTLMDLFYDCCTAVSVTKKCTESDDQSR